MPIKLKNKLYFLCTIHSVSVSQNVFVTSISIIDGDSSSNLLYEIPPKYEDVIFQYLHSQEPLLISLDGLKIDSILCFVDVEG